MRGVIPPENPGIKVIVAFPEPSFETVPALITLFPSSTRAATPEIEAGVPLDVGTGKSIVIDEVVSELVTVTSNIAPETVTKIPTLSD